MWDIDLSDTDLDLLDKDIPSSHFVCLQDVLKTPSRHAFKTSARHVFKASSRRLQCNTFSSSKTSSRRLQDVFARCLKDALKTSRKTKNCYVEDVLKTSSRRLEDQQLFAGMIFVLRQRIFCIDYKGTDKSKNVCVKTLHPTLDKEHVATFSKEAEIIQRTNNRHVVKLIAVSDNPITTVMEFCVFSFTQFDRDATVNSLDEFLSYYDKEDLHCFFPTILHKILIWSKAVQ